MPVDKAINIQCPHCNKENEFKINSGVKCEHCSKEITGFKYLKRAKTGLSTFLAGACIVVGGNVVADKIFDENRYPIDKEYSIIESCVSSYDRPLKDNQFKNKKKICQYVLQETQKDFSYSKFKKDQVGFINKFEENFILTFGEHNKLIGARY